MQCHIRASAQSASCPWDYTSGFVIFEKRALFWTEKNQWDYFSSHRTFIQRLQPSQTTKTRHTQRDDLVRSYFARSTATSQTLTWLLSTASLAVTFLGPKFGIMERIWWRDEPWLSVLRCRPPGLAWTHHKPFSFIFFEPFFARVFFFSCVLGTQRLHPQHHG